MSNLPGWNKSWQIWHCHLWPTDKWRPWPRANTDDWPLVRNNAITLQCHQLLKLATLSSSIISLISFLKCLGVQLVRDPVVLLLDEPTWDLDPLNTYFVVSILANYAKKYNRVVLLTMEKPRSDIFPFLDRVTYLCLGDVVYTGATRMMLDYFRSIGFPCPELENPLMYYCKNFSNIFLTHPISTPFWCLVCLSTVDRRSRERFIESNNQIASLVEKFKLEGGAYRKYVGTNANEENIEQHQKIPLTAYGRPGMTSVLFTLIRYVHQKNIHCVGISNACNFFYRYNMNCFLHTVRLFLSARTQFTRAFTSHYSV